MTTDFSYGGKQTVISGPIKPGGKDMPGDARTRVDCYADIASIPNPYVGLKITVKVDETNNNKMTDYIVKSLKANSIGLSNTLIDEVVRYVDYLGANTSESSGEGLTSEQVQQLQTAYEHSQSAHVSMDEVNEAIANAQLSGGEVDLSAYATKTYTDNAISTALDGHTFKFLTQAEYDALETKDPLVKYHITDAADKSDIDTSNLASDLSLVGTSLQLKNSNGILIGSAIILPSSESSETSNITLRDVASDEEFPLNAILLNIIATYSQGAKVVYNDDSLDSLKSNLVVTANYSDGTTQTITNYTLSGTLSVGTSTITVTYNNKTTTFDVAVTQRPTLTSIAATYNQGSTVIYPSTSLDSLKANLTVVANYSDSTTATITDYVLSGTLSVGTSSVTVTYNGKTTTFNVTVIEEPTLNSITAVYTQGDTTIYPSSSLDSLKSNLVVTANYSDNSSTAITDYSLSGTLTVGASVITVTYGEKTTTFDVIVSEEDTSSLPYAENCISMFNFSSSNVAENSVIDLSGNNSTCALNDITQNEDSITTKGKTTSFAIINNTESVSSNIPSTTIIDYLFDANKKATGCFYGSGLYFEISTTAVKIFYTNFNYTFNTDKSTANERHKLALTLAGGERSTTEASLYIDGELIETATIGKRNDNTNSSLANFGLGGYYRADGSITNPTIGTYYNCGFYKKALTASEIAVVNTYLGGF